MYLAAVERSAKLVAEMAGIFRDAENFMIASLFAETPLSDEQSSYLSGKQDAAIIAINGLMGLAGTREDHELIRHYIREGVL
jgi:hypothetical protein